MTTDEKRQKLVVFCDEHTCHSRPDAQECPFIDNVFCHDYSMHSANDVVIEAWYDHFFGKDTVVPTIKDSGSRTEFDTGAVRDMHEGKGRMDLLPWAAIMEVSKHCENGAKKYGEHNVDRGIPTHSLCDSAARHLAKHFDGWTDEPHLLAAAWNILWAIQMELKNPDMCDVPWRGDNNGSMSV